MTLQVARIALALLILSLVLGSVACGSAQQPTPTSPPPTAAQPDGASLLQARCTRCHTLDRVQQASKSVAEWETTVARMRAKGAQLSDAEAQTLIRHLAETYGK